MQPFKQVDLAFKVGGYIQEILQVQGVDGQKRNAQEGDRVVKGTVLARVREIDYVVKRNEAQAQLAEVMGVTWNTVARWETGQRRIPKIAAILLRYLESDPHVKATARKG